MDRVLKKAALSFFITCLLVTSGCAAMEDQSSQPDYEDTKKMMVDMLKTDEGKQAIQEVLQDEKVRSSVVMDQVFVKDTIENTLTTTQGKGFWEEMMKDAEFKKSLAESMQQKNEDVLKGLMKDPEYQQMFVDVMHDPEMEEHYLELMQSKEYRQQVMNIMAEAFESPYFVARLNQILGDVAKEQMEKQDEENKKQEEQQDDSAQEEEDQMGQTSGQGGGG
ncbi:spore germination lipoprotein GerD [Alteribacter keqinensis]|uniref:Spore gernimation protein GerD n=1 Tax=Alteribacter keqinensis TaxID=2483800 RepID=A0A3M7TME2_9BACI|nr:spore germination lipoprotein GerD [Alteribacter keqinensis]RNA66242.1 spore gernimation protein GerD [Alteribacter keqinensis]